MLQRHQVQLRYLACLLVLCLPHQLRWVQKPELQGQNLQHRAACNGQQRLLVQSCKGGSVNSSNRSRSSSL